MTEHLCISVTFLDSLFHGQGDEAPEWPPSPMRLAQALMAGARTGCRGRAWNDVRAGALGLLGGRVPLIIAPATQPAIRCTYFVPNNNSDTVVDRQDCLTSKVAQPHRLVGGESVHYVWPIEPGEEDDARARLVCDDAKHLLALGWGIDQVVGCGRILSEAEVAKLPGRRWRAWRVHRTGSQGWRVPAADFVEDLEKAYGLFVQRVDGLSYRPHRKPIRFDSVYYLSSTTLPPRAYAALELPDGVGFRPESTAAVAAMLRSLTCRCAKADTHEFPGGAEVYVAGHAKTDEQAPRFTYLPLPTIGHEHADGVIRRLLIAEPFDGAGVHASWAQQRLRNSALEDKHGDERGVLLDLWRPSSRRVVGRYVSESRVWCSVTPVVLPGIDDGKQAKAERLLLKAVAQAKIPIEAIDSLTLRKAPLWPGSAHPRRYFVPEYLRRFSRWHAVLHFHEPVPGPLAIGAGRHVGLGLFAVQDDTAQRVDT
ncbi:MAG: type I-U CRISPR-associated protein Csb2 [Acidobacteriota bacterium]